MGTLTKNADVNTIVNYTQHGDKWRHKKANNQTNNSMCMNNSTNLSKKKKNNKNKKLESIKQKMDEVPHTDSEKGETDDTTEEERIDNSSKKKEQKEKGRYSISLRKKSIT